MDEGTRKAIALGREHYAQRDYLQAEAYLTQALASGARGFADVHNMLGVIHHDAGRLEQAKEAFEQALSINARYTEAALNLAVTLNDLGDYAGAQAIYSRAVQPEDTEVDSFARGKIANLHAEVAQAYLDLEMPNEAIQELRSAIRLCPGFADLRVRLAEVYHSVGDQAAARYELGEAIRVRPDFVRARVALGVAHLVSGDRVAAVTALEAALSLAPQDNAAKMYLRVAQSPPAEAPRPPGPDPEDPA